MGVTGMGGLGQAGWVRERLEPQGKAPLSGAGLRVELAVLPQGQEQNEQLP